MVVRAKSRPSPGGGEKQVLVPEVASGDEGRGTFVAKEAAVDLVCFAYPGLQMAAVSLREALFPLPRFRSYPFPGGVALEP